MKRSTIKKIDAKHELDNYHEDCNGRYVQKVAKYYSKWYIKWRDVLGWSEEKKQKFEKDVNHMKLDELDDEYCSFDPEDYLESSDGEIEPCIFCNATSKITITDDLREQYELHMQIHSK